MTTHRDFKRLVRSRMTKTGESYTSARLQLLKHKTKAGTGDRALGTVSAATSPTASVPRPPSPVPAAEYAKVAGMSDAAMKKATGCAWDRWVWALDKVEAWKWPHGEIARHVHEKYKVPGWWTQTVTVGYERIKGLREKGQRRDGGFEANRSKTFPVPVGRLFRAWSDKKTRSRWLAGVDLKIRTSRKDRSMRISWADGTAVDLWFMVKDKSKSQVAVQHRKLADKAAAERMKAYWTEQLAALADVLTPARAKSAA